MEVRQIPISTSSVRISIQDTVGNAVRSFPRESVIKTVKAVLKSVASFSKKILFQLANATINLLNLLSNIFSSTASLLKRKTAEGGTSVSQSGRRIRRPSKKLTKTLLYLGIAGIAIFGLSKLIGAIGSSGSSDQKIEVKGAKATQDINREFTFPLRDSSGEIVSNLKYFIEKAELRDEIIVKGKRATAVKGRTFLIVTLKITNEYDQQIEINTRDYVRLSVNKNEEEWLAPDIHNDKVEVQAISTKYTRLGFPINDTDKDLVLRVGEIDGDKEKINLELN